MDGVKERDPTAFYQKDVFGKPTRTCTSTIELLTGKYYDEEDEVQEKCKGLRLTRSDLVQFFKEFYETQTPNDILWLLATKGNNSQNPSFSVLASLKRLCNSLYILKSNSW